MECLSDDLGSHSVIPLGVWIRATPILQLPILNEMVSNVGIIGSFNSHQRSRECRKCPYSSHGLIVDIICRNFDNEAVRYVAALFVRCAKQGKKS